MLKRTASSSTGVNQLRLLPVPLADFNTRSRPVATKGLSAHLPSILVGCGKTPRSQPALSQEVHKSCHFGLQIIFELHLVISW